MSKQNVCEEDVIKLEMTLMNNLNVALRRYTLHIKSSAAYDVWNLSCLPEQGE